MNCLIPSMKGGSKPNLPPQDFCEEGEKKHALKVGFTTQASAVFKLRVWFLSRVSGHSGLTPWSLAGSVTSQLHTAQWTHSTTETLLLIWTRLHSGTIGQKIQLLGIFALSQSIPQCIWERRWNEGCATANWMHNPKNEDRQKYPNIHRCWGLCLRTCVQFCFSIIVTNEVHGQKGTMYKMRIRSAWVGQ